MATSSQKTASKQLRLAIMALWKFGVRLKLFADSITKLQGTRKTRMLACRTAEPEIQRRESASDPPGNPLVKVVGETFIASCSIVTRDKEVSFVVENILSHGIPRKGINGNTFQRPPFSQLYSALLPSAKHEETYFQMYFRF